MKVQNFTFFKTMVFFSFLFGVLSLVGCKQSSQQGRVAAPQAPQAQRTQAPTPTHSAPAANLFSSAWTKQTPSNWAKLLKGVENEALYDIAWGNNKYMIVGSNGAILTRTNIEESSWTKISWRLQDNASSINSELRAAIWTGTQFVVVGSEGTILTSPDGVTWQEQTSGVSVELMEVVWTGENLIVAGTFGVILTSVDGVIWSKRTLPTTKWLYGIVWSGELLVAVGQDGVVLTSANGIDWTEQSSSVNNSLLSIAWTGEKFVATGQDGVILVGNADGITWRKIGGIPGFPYLYRSIIWTGNRLMALGGSQVVRILESTNGESWTYHRLDEDSTGASLEGGPYPESILLANGQFMIVGNKGLFLSASQEAVQEVLQEVP